MKPKVAFLIPAYNNIPIQSWQSHIQLVSNARRFCEPLILTNTSCYINQTRNLLANRLLGVDVKEPIDYAFWIDSDIQFVWSDCAELLLFLETNKADMATGIYNIRRGTEKKPVIAQYDSEKDGYEFLPITPKDPAKIVDSAGFGFVCMRTDVLKNIAAHADEIFRYRLSYQGKMIGEDHCFFEDAKELGYELWAVPSIWVGHAKTEII